MIRAALGFVVVAASFPVAWGLRLASAPASPPEGAELFDATPTELANATKAYQLGAEHAAQALRMSPHNTTALARGTTNASASTAEANPVPTFQSYVDGHSAGRGVWKWNNALAAYQRHFAALAGHRVHVAEVGIQSGGSIGMWQSVLGGGCYVHGIDINKACTKFTNGRTTITIGDQADPAMWHWFFQNVAPQLDILVDDGGHEAHQMRTTLVQVLPRLQPGGVIAIEDVHGQHYVKSFFTPAANYLAHMAAKGQVESVHVYPYLLIVQKPGQAAGLPKARISLWDKEFSPVPTVSSYQEFWDKAPFSRGRIVTMYNPSWGSHLSADGLTNHFAYFGGLHDYSYMATPQGCEHTAAARCRVDIMNSPTQAMISGVHIFWDRAHIEVPQTPPLITAVRAGTEWMSYA